MALIPLQGTLGEKRAAHLLRRSIFGPSKVQIDLFANLSAPEAVQMLFMADLPDPELPIDPATGTEWVLSGTTDQNSGGNELIRFFKSWFLGQMMGNNIPQEQQLSFIAREKVVLFMHTHFTTKESVVNNSRALYFQNQLFRQFAFDRFADESIEPINFKSLSQKICIDNAMLRFLDGRLNVKNNPNENFARELLELYTIGRGLEATLPEASAPGDYILFTEQDIQQAALVLSGWNTDETFSNIDEATNLPKGIVKGGANANQHDNGIKTFSERFNGAVIQPDEALLQNGNPTEESALDEISQLIDLIYSNEETAKHICRKLYRFYVYHDITEAIDEAVINEMARTFAANDYKIQPVLEELLQSQHFYEAGGSVDDNQFGGIIKSPLDLTVGTFKSFGLNPPSMTDSPEDFYEFTGEILNIVEGQGMNFYEPFEVAGYSAYHQFPTYNRNWISTNYLARRYDFIRNIMTGMNEEMPLMGIDALSFTREQFGEIAGDARELVMAYCRFLLPNFESIAFEASPSGEITSERLNYFLFAFLSDPQIDEDPESAWTFRWNNGVDDEVIQNQLVNLLNAIMQSPEYQLF
jgi:uncharacterized protein (DUF1800 family)